MNELPKFFFALREDIRDDKRFLPTRANEKATGWDVRAAMKDHKPLIIRPGEKYLIPLGFRGYCPEGWWMQLNPRSSTFTKKSLHCLYGVIDQDFENQWMIATQYIPDIHSLGKDLIIEFGEALGQLIPRKYEDAEMNEITNEEIDSLYANRKGTRGTGGFGSTGR